MTEGLEELEGLSVYGNAITPYKNTGRFIVLKGKYKGSFVDTVPKGYLEKVILAKWDMTDEERTIIEACSTRVPPG